MPENMGASSSPCAACKLLRRRCAKECVFAPYFPADEPLKFASVHKVFGASNVNKLLQLHHNPRLHSCKPPNAAAPDVNSSLLSRSRPVCLYLGTPWAYKHGAMDGFSCGTNGCLLAPFEISHLQSKELPEYQRGDAVSSMVYEANARVRDPVYGCVGAISSLQQQVAELQTQLAVAQAEIVRLRMYQGSNPIHADRKGDIANAISPPVAPSSPSR